MSSPLCPSPLSHVLLKHALTAFAHHALLPLVGVEIEFYLIHRNDHSPAAPPYTLWQHLQAACLAENIQVQAIEAESGPGQFEMQLAPYHDILVLAQHIEKARTLIQHHAFTAGYEALFTAKPFPTQPGSSLHLHVSLWNTQHHPVFQKLTGAEETPAMLHALAGLLTLMPATMLFFVPSPEAFARHQPRTEAPTHVSWGGNNRTVALRIPPADPRNRRIEHRLAAAEANPYLALSGLLMGMDYGFHHHLIPPPRIYGEAFHPQYDAPPLPTSYEEALHLFEIADVVHNYFGPELASALKKDFITHASNA